MFNICSDYIQCNLYKQIVQCIIRIQIIIKEEVYNNLVNKKLTIIYIIANNAIISPHLHNKLIELLHYIYKKREMEILMNNLI